MRTITRTLLAAAILALGVTSTAHAVTQNCEAIAVNQQSKHVGNSFEITTESGAVYLLEGVEDEPYITTKINIDSPAIEGGIKKIVTAEHSSIDDPVIICEPVEVEEPELVERPAPEPIFETIPPVVAVDTPDTTDVPEEIPTVTPPEVHIDTAPPAKAVVGNPTYTG